MSGGAKRGHQWDFALKFTLGTSFLEPEALQSGFGVKYLFP